MCPCRVSETCLPEGVGTVMYISTNRSSDLTDDNVMEVFGM